MVFGLTRTLDVIEAVVGAYYCLSLLCNTEGWLKDNMKAKASPDTIFLTQICGAICLGLRLMTHHARTVGAGADLFADDSGLNGIKLDYFAALIWGLIAWFDHKNEALFTEQGLMNKKICGVFAAAFIAAGAGVLPAF